MHGHEAFELTVVEVFDTLWGSHAGVENCLGSILDNHRPSPTSEVTPHFLPFKYLSNHAISRVMASFRAFPL